MRWRTVAIRVAGAQPVGAGRGIEGLEHLQAGEGRQIFLHGVVEAEPALLDELHRRGRGDRLGHRGDAEQRVGRERAAGRDVRHAERALIEGPLAVGRHGDDARDGLVLRPPCAIGVERSGRWLRAGASGQPLRRSLLRPPPRRRSGS